jgi:hypothetical protein
VFFFVVVSSQKEKKRKTPSFCFFKKEKEMEPPSLLHQLAEVPDSLSFGNSIRDAIVALEAGANMEEQDVLSVTRAMRPLMRNLMGFINLMKIPVSPMVPKPVVSADPRVRVPKNPTLNDRAKAAVPLSLIPDGIAVTMNQLEDVRFANEKSELKEFVADDHDMDHLSNDKKALINPYLVIDNPAAAEIISGRVIPLTMTLKPEQVAAVRKEAEDFIKLIASSEPLKVLIMTALNLLLRFVTSMQVSEAFLSVNSRQLHSVQRTTSFLVLYQVYLNLAAFASIYWTPNRGIIAEFGYEMDAFEGQEAALHRLSPYPRYCIYFVRQGIRTLCNKMNYSQPGQVNSIHRFVRIAARCLMVESDMMEKILFRETVMRLAFFHIQTLTCYNEISVRIGNGSFVAAQLEKEVDPITYQSLYLRKLVEENSTVELAPMSKSNYFNLLNTILALPGEGKFEKEKEPIHNPHPVKVLDNASVTDHKETVKFVESTPFYKFLTDPGLIMKSDPPPKIPEAKAVLCLIYLFLLDFYLSSLISAGEANSSISKIYVNSHLAIYPNTLDESKYGGVVLMGKQFFVNSPSGWIFVNNNPPLLFHVVKDILERNNQVYSKAVRELGSTVKSSVKEKERHKMDMVYTLI